MRRENANTPKSRRFPERRNIRRDPSRTQRELEGVRTLRSAWRRYVHRRQVFYRDNRAVVAEENMRMLRRVSLASLGVLFALLIITPFVVHGWTPSVYHIAFVPALIVLNLVIWLMPEPKSARTVTALCVLFQAVMFSFVVMIDAVSAPEAPSSFMQLVAVAMMAIFALPAIVSYSILGVAELVYSVLVVLCKDPFIAQYDLFEAVTGIAFAVGVSQLVLSYRVKTYEIRKRFEILSTRDALSSLFNKRAFLERAQSYLAERNPHVTCALVIIDLDDFKEINDRMGHAAGDAVLRSMGTLLMEQFRPTDIVGRFGGDEYVILADHMVSEAALADRARDIQRQFGEVIQIELGISPTCSVGMVYAVMEPVDLDELFHQADQALYHVKRGGKASLFLQRYEQPQEREAGAEGVRRASISRCPEPQEGGWPANEAAKALADATIRTTGEKGGECA